jgi:hypothetical protein
VHARKRHEALRIVEAAWRRLPEGAVFSGLTAAWLHGLDVDPADPIEFTVPKSLGVTTRSGMAVRRSVLSRDEVVVRHGFPTTTPLRTLLDISCRQPLVEAVVVADMALHTGVIKPDALVASLGRYEGTWGVKALRQVAWHAEPATESPMETRMRIIVVLGGLPRPQAQVSIYDGAGNFLGRPDLYYPAERLGLEYDGSIHHGTLVEDNRRQNRLLNAGVRLLRFGAGDIYGAPDSVVALVRAQLYGSVHTTA